MPHRRRPRSRPSRGAALDAAFGAALVLAIAGCARTPVAAPARSVPAPAPLPIAAPPTASTPEAYRASAGAVVDLANAQRRTARRASLTTSAALVQAAELEAAQIVGSGTLAHELPAERYPTLAARLAAVRYVMRAAGENIGQGFATPRAAMAAWMASAGHRANILSANYGETGAAVARARDGSLVWVQVFATPR